MKLGKLFFVLLICFSSYIVHANVTINEIMYDLEGTDTDREWIEVYNSGTDPIDLSTWKFVEGNSNHSLVPFDGGSTIAPSGYAVIADKPEKFKADWPNFSGVLFDSSFSLNNDPGETLALKDSSSVVVDTITYVTSVGAQGDGNTLNRSVDVFIVASATPGIENATTGDTSENGNNIDDGNNPPPTNSGNGGGTIPSQKQIEPTTPKINAQITSKLSVVAGTPIVFEPKIIGYSGESLSQGKFFWNFGDGMSLEKNVNEKITYTYDTAGEYVVSLEYTRNQYQLEPDATDRVVVQVTEPAIVISSVGSDGSIELTNKSSREIDLSGWIMNADNNSFSFSKNTIILAGRKIVLTPKVTHFPRVIQQTSILLPNNQIASIYPEIKKDVVVKAQSTKISYEPAVAKAYANVPEQPSLVLNQNTTGVYEPISLSANAISAVDENSIGINQIIPIGVFALVLGGGVGSAWYFRRKKKIKTEADEFELVE